jgi:hypothetical protein
MDEKIFELIDSRAKVLVGTLLKKIEVLASENALTPDLYKKLVKDSIYEEFRTLKAMLSIGSVVFITKKSEE